MLYKEINREVSLGIDMLCRSDSRTGAAHKISEHKKDLSQILFFIRTIPDWNKLPSDVNLAPTSTAFKARLKKSDPCNPPPVAR